MGPILAFLLLVSVVLRGFSVGSLPPELFGDEIDVGYQAFSLFKTGKDLYGQNLPVYIHSLSEWRTPLLFYYTVPSVAVLGNNAFAVRFPEVIMGALAPIILFALVYQTTRSKIISLFSALVLAIMPWHILYSRMAFEAVVLLNFIMLGTLFFVKKRMGWSLLFFAFTPYIYSTASVFVPLWLVALFLINRPKLKLVYFLPLLILLPFAWSVFFGKAAERFGKVGIFSNPEIIDTLTFLRGQSSSPIERYVSNRPVFVAKKIFINYLSAFSTEFLFIKGDVTARQSLQYIGQLFPVWAPFVVLGFIYLFTRRQWVWLVWLALAPIPSALTYDGANHATRLFMMIPTLAVSVGSGMYWLLSGRKKFFAAAGYFVIWMMFIVQFIDAANYYTFHYTKNTWRWWHYGYREAFSQIMKLDSQYARVYINNTYEPALIRFLFYSKYDPSLFQKVFSSDKPEPGVAPDYHGFFLEPKYYFGGFSLPAHKSIPDILKSDSLYLISQRDDVGGDWDWRKSPPGGVKVLSAVTDPNGFPIFYLITRAQ